ncbi:aspartic peptidase domain-containing protein [Xylaria intraflava]|nr:aspartic peptidase domain-containing protein [Xylaria intraflava]
MPDLCQAFGRYDPAMSSTGQKIASRGFAITYGSGNVTGAYHKDDIYISGAKIEAQQFGVANSSDLVWFGIMGLGHGQGNGFARYPLIVDSLATQKLTNTRLFSLDLGGQIAPGSAVTGEMAFGGVDTNKYAGLLKKVPTDPSDPHYKVTLNSLAHRAPGAGASTSFTDSNLPLPVIVDSGTTLSLLPESIVNKLAAQFPGATPDGNGGYQVDCAYQGRDGSVDFEFLAGTETVTINVAYRDFIWNSGGSCFLGASYSKSIGVWILGDTFLRGAYVAFDQTNNALFMSNYIPCDGRRSKLVAVPAGPNAAGNIPGACPEVSFPSAPKASSSCSSELTVGTPFASPSLVRPEISTAALPEAVATATSTFTHAIVYTATACPDSVTKCPLRGQVATRFKVITTTICPEHEVPSAKGDAVLITASIPANTAIAKVEDIDIVPNEKDEEEEDVIVPSTPPAAAIYAATAWSQPCVLDTTATRVIAVAETVHLQSASLGTHTYKNATPTRDGNSSHTAPVIAAAGHLDRRGLGIVLAGIWSAMALL